MNFVKKDIYKIPKRKGKSAYTVDFSLTFFKCLS